MSIKESKNKKQMSSPSRHDDDRNAGDVMATEPQLIDRPLTNVNTADATEQTRVVETDEQDDATEQTMIFSDLEWISTAPR